MSVMPMLGQNNLLVRSVSSHTHRCNIVPSTFRQQCGPTPAGGCRKTPGSKNDALGHQRPFVGLPRAIGGCGCFLKISAKCNESSDHTIVLGKAASHAKEGHDNRKVL